MRPPLRWFLLLTTVAACLPPAAAASPARPASTPPRVLAFSPAAAHPRDAFLVDAVFDGERPPRVFVGGRRVPRRDVRIDDAVRADGARRVWARVPRRMRPGEHELRLVARGGSAVAAKTLTVASCDPETEEPPACGNIPNSGAHLVVTGAGGYRRVLRSNASLEPQVIAGQTLVEFPGPGDIRFSMNIPLAAGDIARGTTRALHQTFHSLGAQYGYWQLIDGTVTVAEVSSTRVGVCIDAVLPGFGSEPAEVRVRGHVVFVR